MWAWHSEKQAAWSNSLYIKHQISDYGCYPKYPRGRVCSRTPERPGERETDRCLPHAPRGIEPAPSGAGAALQPTAPTGLCDFQLFFSVIFPLKIH